MKKPFIYLVIALFCCAACSNDPEVNIEPQAPRLNVNDSLAIVDIWEKADGKNWAIQWDLKDFWTWGGAGIILDKEKNEYRIVKLIVNIPESSMVKGTISPKLGDLTELCIFMIGGKGITGKLPKSIANLSKIVHFTVSHTSIIDTIPGSLFLSPQIKSIEFMNNPGITGKLPVEILELPKDMLSLRFEYNSLSGKIPTGLKLDETNVVLIGNKYTEFPFEYCNEDVAYLDLSNNEITGIIPDSILNNEKAIEKLFYSTMRQKEGFGFDNPPKEWAKHK
ncbi:MAG: hypothetical protein ACRCR3_09480 [Tannerellaceae bacterium]